jgi:hypothetical protein
VIQVSHALTVHGVMVNVSHPMVGEPVLFFTVTSGDVNAGEGGTVGTKTDVPSIVSVNAPAVLRWWRES